MTTDTEKHATRARTAPADAHAVHLDASKLDVESPASVATQIPPADARPPGSAVVVDAVATRKRGALGRLIGDAHVKVAKSVRCTALLARGYVGIEAAAEAQGDRVWGESPLDPHPSAPPGSAPRA